GVADGALQQRAAQQLASHRQLAQELLACSKGSCPTHSNELINDGRHSQLQIRPSLQFSAKAAIQTANMMFSILRRKVARLAQFPARCTACLREKWGPVATAATTPGLPLASVASQGSVEGGLIQPTAASFTTLAMSESTLSVGFKVASVIAVSMLPRCCS